MRQISDEELLRRLTMIRDIRIGNIKKTGLSDSDCVVGYTVPINLEQAEEFIIEDRKIVWYKNITEKTITHYDPVVAARLNGGEVQGYWGDSEIVQGNFKKELGYIFVKPTVLNPDCSNSDIVKIEDDNFKVFLSSLIYSYTSDIKYKTKLLLEEQGQLKSKQLKLNNLQRTLDDLNLI